MSEQDEMASIERVRMAVLLVDSEYAWEVEIDDVEAMLAEYDRLRTAAEKMAEALRECAAEWSTPPTTVGEVAGHLGLEFVRRMEVADAALRDYEGSKMSQQLDKPAGGGALSAA